MDIYFFTIKLFLPLQILENFNNKIFSKYRKWNHKDLCACILHKTQASCVCRFNFFSS